MVLVNGKDVRPNYKVKALDDYRLFGHEPAKKWRSCPRKFP